jgi:hypothetical protein
MSALTASKTRRFVRKPGPFPVYREAADFLEVDIERVGNRSERIALP